MIVEQSKQIIAEIEKALIGKREIVEKALMTIYAGCHVLLEDCPGVGKTTLALAFSRVLGLDHKRIQFTTDTLLSDITGFSVWNRETRRFDYRDGVANCQPLLASWQRSGPRPAQSADGRREASAGGLRHSGSPGAAAVFLWRTACFGHFDGIFASGGHFGGFAPPGCPQAAPGAPGRARGPGGTVPPGDAGRRRHRAFPHCRAGGRPGGGGERHVWGDPAGDPLLPPGGRGPAGERFPPHPPCAARPACTAPGWRSPT